MNRILRAACAVASLACASALAQEAQFDFMLGQWQLEVKPKVSSLAAAIHGAPKLAGTWKAWRALDGLAIEDEVRIVDASGNPISFSHALRIYSKVERRWKVGTLDAYRARFTESSGEAAGGEIRTVARGTDTEGHPMLTRVRYFGIQPDAFRVQQDRSTDDGKTWDEGVLAIVARRTAAAPAR